MNHSADCWGDGDQWIDETGLCEDDAQAGVLHAHLDGDRLCHPAEPE
jgi:hypothetical protein